MSEKGLRVVVVPDDDAFFAQGVDVDYFASGQTKEEAEKNFEDGLETLVALHLKKFDHVEHLRRPTSLQVTQEYAKLRFISMETHQLHGMAEQHLYSKAVYYLPE